MKLLRSVIILFALLFSLTLFGAEPKLPDRGICAHQGANTVFPHNSVPALRTAVRMGVQMVEFDVKFTKDNQLIVLHDVTVDRVTNGTGAVKDMTLDELRKLRKKMTKSGPAFEVGIPTFDEAIDPLPRDIWINVHIGGSQELVFAVAKKLREKNRTHQAFIATGLNAIRKLKKEYPEILVCNMSRRANSADYVSETIAEHCDFIQLRSDNYTPEDVIRLKKAGIRVNIYGANAVKLLQTMFDQGVDFVLVDMTEAMQKAAIPKGIKPIVRNEKPEVDTDLTVLISDIHIGVDAMKTGYAADNDMKLKVLLERIVSMTPRPGRVVILGDLAYNRGTKADYEKLKPVLNMLDQAGIPWTSAMGNHDRRGPFAEVFPEKASQSLLAGRNVFVVPTPSFDFILLDSLNEGTVKSTTDTAQMKWLDSKLAQYAKSGRKAFVCAHHPMSETGANDILAKYPQVVIGYIFGHHHNWQYAKVGSIETVGMPSTGYSPKHPPLGYVTLKPSGDTCRFTLLTSDVSDEKNRKTFDIPLVLDK